MQDACMCVRARACAPPTMYKLLHRFTYVYEMWAVMWTSKGTVTVTPLTAQPWNYMQW